MPNPTKPLAELTVNDVTQAYDDAFDAPSKAVPDKAPAVTEGGGKPAAVVPETAPEAEPARRRRPDGTFMASHSPYWLRKAAEAGLGDAEIDSMEPDELRQAVQVEIHSRGRAVAETNSIKPVAETPAPKPTIEIKDEDYEPGLAGILKSVVARLDAIDARDTARQQRGLANALDRLFDADKAIFGAGSTADILAKDPNSPEAVRRQMLVQQLNVLASAGQKTTLEKDYAKIKAAFGMPATPKVKGKPAAEEDDEHLWNRDASGRREPSEEVPAGRNRLNQREEEWAEGAVEKPTHRNKPELPKGVEKAKRTFSNGVKLIEEKRAVSGETDENEDLPG